MPQTALDNNTPLLSGRQWGGPTIDTPSSTARTTLYVADGQGWHCHGTTLFPSLSLLFFVVPQPFAQDPRQATAAAAQLAVFAVMSVCLFTYGVGVAEDRALPWDGYLRTLPVGPLPRLTGRLLTGLAFVVIGLVPLVLIAWLMTAATLPLSRLAMTVAALLAAGVPLFALGITIGYSLSTKAAMAVAQSLLLPLAFGGGLFLPPNTFPGWLDAISTWLPTRAGRDLVVTATTGTDLPGTTLLMLGGWTLLTGSLAVWAYRRDEGRRFRFRSELAFCRDDVLLVDRR